MGISRKFKGVLYYSLIQSPNRWIEIGHSLVHMLQIDSFCSNAEHGCLLTAQSRPTITSPQNRPGLWDGRAKLGSGIKGVPRGGGNGEFPPTEIFLRRMKNQGHFT